MPAICPVMGRFIKGTKENTAPQPAETKKEHDMVINTVGIIDHSEVMNDIPK